MQKPNLLSEHLNLTDSIIFSAADQGIIEAPEVSPVGARLLVSQVCRQGGMAAGGQWGAGGAAWASRRWGSNKLRQLPAAASEADPPPVSHPLRYSAELRLPTCF